MGLHLVAKNVLVMHIPFCAGNWVRRVLEASTIDVRPAEIPGGLPSEHGLRHQYENKFDGAIGFVRHPLTWYESYWSRICWTKSNRSFEPRSQTRRFLPHIYLPLLCNGSFADFIEACLEYQPGFVTRMYEWYLGPLGSELVGYIGRLENLRNNLKRALMFMGYEPPGEIDTFPPVNASTRPSGEAECIWPEDLKTRVLAAERPAIDRFYAVKI